MKMYSYSKKGDNLHETFFHTSLTPQQHLDRSYGDGASVGKLIT